MFSPRIILVPIDLGSASSDRALAEATVLARAYGAEIHVFHALALPPGGVGDFSFELSADASAKIVTEAKRWMGAIASKYNDGSTVLRTILDEGDPRTRILACAERVGADLIVMGTHGREGLARLLIGSTAEAIVRTSAVPVLTVRAP